MADSRISDLTAASVVAAANQLEINEAGTSKRVTADQIKDFVENAPVLAAGSASANTWPKFTAGTLLTTAEVGAIELDANAFYATTDAGNRGVIPVRHLIRANATNTLSSVGTEQKLFASPTNGRLTLETGTYLFESMLYLTAMSATSGNAALDWLGAGTAVIDDWMWHAVGSDAAAAAAGAQQVGTFAIVQQSVASVVSAATQTAMYVTSKGTFTVTTAGTIIPSITLVTAAAAILAIGSYFFCERIGSTTLTSIGQWD